MVKVSNLRTMILWLALLAKVSSFVVPKHPFSFIEMNRMDDGSSETNYGTFENVQKNQHPPYEFKTASNTCLHAIIYGWDGEDSDEITDTSASSSVASSRKPYITVESEVGPDSCTPEGLEVAMSLSEDRGRMGSFARLAAAFSPPERGIGIKDIEKVEVTCVREDSIELEAILCETYGCVTLTVPVQFPTECGGTDLGCAIQNLDTLDIRAETMVSARMSRVSKF